MMTPRIIETAPMRSNVLSCMVSLIASDWTQGIIADGPRQGNTFSERLAPLPAFQASLVALHRRYHHSFSFDFSLHSYDYISLFVSFFDIAVRLGSLFQRIASIYDRLYLSRLSKLFEENQILVDLDNEKELRTA